MLSMRHFVLILCAMISVANCRMTPASVNHSPPDPPKLREYILRTPEKELDLLLATLLSQKEIDPRLDIEKYLTIVNNLAKDLRQHLENVVSTDEKLAKMLSFLFFDKRYSVKDTANYITGNNLPELVKLLDNKSGNLSSCQFLALSLAQRFDIPLKAASLPLGMYLVYDNGQRKLNIVRDFDRQEADDNKIRRLFGISEEAVEKGVYMRGLTLRETTAFLLRSLGDYFSAVGDWGRSIEYMDLATQVRPNLIESYTTLAHCYYMLGNISMGEYYLKKSSDLDPNHFYVRLLKMNPIYFNEGQKPALEYIEKIMDMYDSSSFEWATIQLKRAMLLIEMDNSRQAIQILKPLKDRYLDGYDYYNTLSVAYSYSDQLEDAVQSATRAIGIYPTRAHAYFNRAGFYFLLKNYADALDDCHKVLSCVDDRDTLYIRSTHLRLVFTYTELGEYEKAWMYVYKLKDNGARIDTNASYIQKLERETNRKVYE